MNYIKSLFLPIMFVSVCTSAANVRLLQQAEINKKHVEIEKQIIRDKRMVLGIKAFAHVQEIYMFCSLVSPFFVDTTPTPLSQCDACIEKSKITVPFFTAIWSGLTNAGHNTKNLFTTSQGWLTLGGWGLYYGSCFAALYTALHIAQSMPDEFVHPDTLRWYYNTHAPCETTTQLMKEVIITLQDQTLGIDHVDYNKKMLAESLDRLARYGESICAYMAYKIKHLDEYEKPIAERAARYFFKYYNDWLMTIFAQCELNNPDYDHINKLIISYETEVAAQLRHFYAIEGETKADRRAVKKRE